MKQFKKEARQPRLGEQARQIQAVRATRALIVAIVVALAVASVLSLTFLAPSSPPLPSHSRGSRSFSPTVTLDEWRAHVRASQAAYNMFIKRDRVQPELDTVINEYLNREYLSEPDIFQLFQHLGKASGDDYFAIVPNDRYQHLKALMRRAKIGIEIETRWDPTAQCFVINTIGTKAQAEADRQDLKVGDRIIAFDDFMLNPQQVQRNVGNWQQAVANYIQSGGLLGSQIKLTVRRFDGTKLLPQKDVWLTRIILEEEAPFSVEDWKKPIENVQDPQVKEITIKHLETSNSISDIFTELTKMSQVEGGLKGVIVDLRNLQAGDAEKALQVAAMFLKTGVISHRLETARITSTDAAGQKTEWPAILIRTYVIERGQVHRKTWGPYRVEAGGAIDPAAGRRDPQKPDRDEILPWQVGVIDCPVIAIASRTTGGAGELLAAAFRDQWESTMPRRCELVAKYLTIGNGTGRTFFPVLNGTFWLQVSTSYYLAPDGSKIDNTISRGRVVGLQPNVGIPEEVDEMVFARQLMYDRLNVIEKPDILPVFDGKR